MNNKELVESCIRFIHLKRLVPFSNYKKCERDLLYIVDSISKDLKNKTTIFITRTANKFWYAGQRQIKNHKIEISVYNFLKEELQKNLSAEDFELAKQSIDTLIRIVDEGPETNDLGTKILHHTTTAEHCQRNWDLSYQVPEQDLDVLIQIATTMPTKQNREHYKLLVSTDLNFNEQVLRLSIDPDVSETIQRNNQVNANILFIYINNDNYDLSDLKKIPEPNDIDVSIGISSGGLALAASQLDYRVGFCKCFLREELKKLIDSKCHDLLSGEYPQLMLGVGKPNMDYNWNDVIDKNNVRLKSHVPTYTKSIKVYQI